MRGGVSGVVFVACGVVMLLVGGNDERRQNDQRAREAERTQSKHFTRVNYERVK